MTEKATLKQLKEILGFSKNEAKVYLFLLQNGNYDPADIGQKLDLPKSRVYETLSKLASRNVLRKLSDKFGYEIIPPKEAINQVSKEMRSNYDKKEIALENMGDYLQNVWTQNLSTEISPGVDLIPFSQAETIFLQDIGTVRKRIFIAASSNVSVMDWRKSGKQLGKALHNNLDVRYLVNSKSFGERLKKSLKLFEPFTSHDNKIEVGFNKNLHISFVLIDNLVYLFFFGTESSLDALTLRTFDKNLLKALEWKFLTLWGTQ